MVDNKPEINLQCACDAPKKRRAQTDFGFMCCAMRNGQVRKTEEGKHKMNVLNNVRNKLIHRIYAVITTGQEYDKNYYLRNISVAA